MRQICCLCPAAGRSPAEIVGSNPTGGMDVAVQQLHKYRYNSTYVRETKKLIYKINIYLCGTMCSIPVITHILRPARLLI